MNLANIRSRPLERVSIAALEGTAHPRESFLEGRAQGSRESRLRQARRYISTPSRISTSARARPTAASKPSSPKKAPSTKSRPAPKPKSCSTAPPSTPSPAGKSRTHRRLLRQFAIALQVAEVRGAYYPVSALWWRQPHRRQGRSARGRSRGHHCRPSATRAQHAQPYGNAPDEPPRCATSWART